MLGGYSLCFVVFFQIVFIHAATDESEYVHIKVHLPDLAGKNTQTLHRLVRQHHHQRQKQQNPIVQKFHYAAKRPLPSTVATHHQHHSSGSSSSPYEFDFFDLGEDGVGGRSNAKDLAPEQLMRIIPNGYGPVLFNNDIESSTVSSLEQPTLMNKQLMHQLFEPEMMSVLDTTHDLNEDVTERSTTHYNTGRRIRPSSLSKNNELLQQYFHEFKSQQNYPTKIAQKRKKYRHQNDEESIEQEPQQEVEQQQRDFQPFHSTAHYLPQPQRQHHQRRQKQSHFQRHQNYNPLHWPFGHEAEEGDEDEGEDVDEGGRDSSDEDISSSASNSNEDITSSFNKLQPISYQDMYDTYATPLTSPTNYGPGQQSLSSYQQTTEPTYSKPSSSNWRQYYHQPQYQQHQHPQVHHEQQLHLQQQQLQQPQKQEQQQQQQRYKKQQQKHPKSKRAKPTTSQQTQFLLPSTLLRITTTTSSSSSSTPTSLSTSLSSPSPASSLSLPTSPINSGFTSGPITSTRTLPWTLPFDFVQQSQQEQHQQQQQYQQLQQQRRQRQHYQQREHEQQLETQQYPRKQQPKLPHHKKRKNRTKRKRTHIIFE